MCVVNGTSKMAVSEAGWSGTHTYTHTYPTQFTNPNQLHSPPQNIYVYIQNNSQVPPEIPYSAAQQPRQTQQKGACQ
jgi:hypothetical protein